MKSSIYKFIKYLRWCFSGGYTEVNLSTIVYPEILKDKRVLITGGSEGIGYAIAKKFSDAGAKVVITGRNIDKLHNAVNLSGGRLNQIKWDVSDVNKIDENLKKVQNIIGGIDILVNNAAYITNERPTLSVFEQTMATNVKSVYLLCSKVCEQMRIENGIYGGHVINISSINAYQSGTHPYFISKRALNAITEGFAKEYTPYNIIVNGIAPGYCNSSINKQEIEKNAYRDEHLNKRITLPEEIAEIALFLCSGAANGIVGQTIACEGGALL